MLNDRAARGNFSSDASPSTSGDDFAGEWVKVKKKKILPSHRVLRLLRNANPISTTRLSPADQALIRWAVEYAVDVTETLSEHVCHLFS
jgi:hypothetical protein